MQNARSNGFTLLEVLLALMLTALLLVALNMAVDVHFRSLDAGQSRVEEAQLARVLLRRIADDLRGAVVGSSQDSQQSGQSSSGTNSSGTSASGTSSSGTSTSQSSGTGSSGSSNSGTTSGGSATTQSTTVNTTPGIYGDSSTLRVDVSRLPQVHQLQAVYSANDGNLPPTSFSAVKTVTYLANGAQGGSAIAGLSPDIAGQQGLVRCEQDRAMALYEAEHGGGSSTGMNAALLAPEVTGLEFAYYSADNGWLDTWDSSLNGGPPVAVRVTIYIASNKSRNAGSKFFGGPSTQNPSAQNSSQPGTSLAYSLVVSLPVTQSQDSGSSTDTSSSNSDSDTSAGNATSNTTTSNTKPPVVTKPPVITKPKP
jgi:prepilin-type N-terminal cleavage/methylation domain-containing protein